MNTERRAWSWRHGLLKSNLPSTTRHVLLTLSCHVNDAGEPCFPTIEQLAQETGLTARSVMKQLSIAKEAGWILVGKHGFAGQKWARREYQIAWPSSLESAEGGERGSGTNDEGGERRSCRNGEGGERRSGKVVNVVHVDTPHLYKGVSHSLLINPSASDDAGVVPFDEFWRAWPATPHKKFKADCRRKWERMKLDRELELILTHVRTVIATSDAAKRDGGQYLQGPRSYLTNAEWREPVKASSPVEPLVRTCSKCGEPAPYRVGGLLLCRNHFHSED